MTTPDTTIREIQLEKVFQLEGSNKKLKFSDAQTLRTVSLERNEIS